MVNELNHHNPEYVTWKYDELSFALLGGIRIEGLHSMRVTLKIDFKTFPSIRHSLDLYNEGQTEKFVKNIAERFTHSTTYIHKAIGSLINVVEDYRLQQIDSNKLKSISNKPSLTKEQITAAENYLKQSNLLQNTNDDIGRSGVIGEEVNHINLNEGIIYIPSTARSNSRTLKLSTPQILTLHTYIHGGTRDKLKPTADELLPGNTHNIVNLLTEELKGINPQIKNALHIRASVILHWLRQHNKRQVQYMAGHKYIGSTEK
jgi:hypothetical protein